MISIYIFQRTAGAKKDERFPEMDYYLNPDLSDVVFVVENQRLPANKALLSIKSQVFRAQFSGNFMDSEQQSIHIPDIMCDAFKAMLLFMHKEHLVISDRNCFELARDIYTLADKYQLKRLMECVKLHFGGQVENKCDFLAIYRLGHLHNDKDLINLSLFYMGNHIEEWNNRSHDELIKLNAEMENHPLKILSYKNHMVKNEFYRISNLNIKCKCSSYQNIGNHISKLNYVQLPGCFFEKGSSQLKKSNFDFSSITYGPI